MSKARDTVETLRTVLVDGDIGTDVLAPDGNGSSLTGITDTTYSVGDGGLTQVNFTTADNTKLDGIAASANNYVHPTGAGYNHMPTGGTVGYVIINTASGQGSWQELPASGVTPLFDKSLF